MDEELRKEFEAKFDAHDYQHTGEITFEEFIDLYRDIENDPTKTSDEALVVFNGIDINNDKTLSKEEFMDLVNAIRTGNRNYLFKMFFRSFDVDRSRNLEANEIIQYFTFCGHKTNMNQAARLIRKKNLYSGKKSLTFAQLYEELTKETIDPDTDPYDGHIPWPKEEEEPYGVVTRSIDLRPIEVINEEELENYTQMYDDFKEEDEPDMSFEEFVLLYRQLERDPKRTEEEARVVFTGLDVNNDDRLSKVEFLSLIKAMLNKDQLWMHMYFFRSFDPKRIRFLDLDSVVAYYKFCNHPITKSQALKIIKKYNSDESNPGLKFSHFYLELTGDKVDDNTDPYDGQRL